MGKQPKFFPAKYLHYTVSQAYMIPGTFFIPFSCNTITAVK